MRKTIFYYRTLWGVNLDYSNINSVRQIIVNFKKQGFSGVEVATGFFDNKYKKDFINLLNELEMGIITQIHTMGYPIFSKSVNEHYDDYLNKIEDSISWNPHIVNSHSGRDDWTPDEKLEFFRKISEFEIKNCKNLTIAHETHRQRVLYDPYNSYMIMKNFPNLKYTADISHWIVTCSRLCNEQTDSNWNEIVSILSRKSALIHARISSTDQIQLVDPFTINNDLYRLYYESIWKEIYNNSDVDVLYIDPEYGPYPYAITDPQSNEMLVDVDLITNKAIKQLKKIFI